jgi:hypothetical protein
VSLDPAKIGLAVQNGLSTVCATCSKYWRARDRNVPEPHCLAKFLCGGPLSGDWFNQYDGPMTEDRFGQWCYRCGGDSDFGLRVEKGLRIIGVCKTHLEDFYRLRPVSEIRSNNQVYLIKDGREIPIKDLLNRPRKKTLMEAIFEVEKYYADKEGRDITGVIL